APARTPAAILDRLNRESVDIFSMPAIQAEIHKAGMTTSGQGRDSLTSFLKQEHVKYRKIIREAGIKDN
ncbi:MAG: tripartite tricarboxylate transporter substrate binding protein, partial [Acetobacteraceae bacterium]